MTNCVSLEKRLNDDMVAAMKNKDALRLSVIRMVKDDIGKTSIRAGKNDLSEDEILKVIQRQIKQHRDSIEQFKAGNRPDLSEKEEKELAILEAYVPAQLTDAELEGIVSDVIRGAGVVTPKDMGRIIKSVMEKCGGKVDGKRVSAAVQKHLKQ